MDVGFYTRVRAHTQRDSEEEMAQRVAGHRGCCEEDCPCQLQEEQAADTKRGHGNPRGRQAETQRKGAAHKSEDGERWEIWTKTGSRGAKGMAPPRRRNGAKAGLDPGACLGICPGTATTWELLGFLGQAAPVAPPGFPWTLGGG